MDITEPHSWIIWKPSTLTGDEENFKHVTMVSNIAQAVRLNYRNIVIAGLRNPETGFNPADYFGFMFPLMLPRGTVENPKEGKITALTFGLMHIDFKSEFFPKGIEKFDPADVNDLAIQKSLRWIGYDLTELTKADTFPYKLRYYKTWQEYQRILTGTMSIGAPHQFIHRTLDHLLNPPGFSEQAVDESTQDLMKKLRGGN